MNRDEIRDVVLRSLEAIAPEADAASLDPKASIRDELDLDSMDFLGFVTGVHDAVGVDIPEVDYPKVDSVEDCVAYVDAKLQAR